MCPGKFVLPVFALSFTIGGILGYLYSPFRVQDVSVIDACQELQPLTDHAPAASLPPALKEAKPFSCKEVSPETSVMVSFRRVSLLELTELVSAYTCQNFILSEKLPLHTEFTLISPKPISVGELDQMFQAALAQEGLALVSEGKFFQIVRAPEAENAAR